MFARKDAWKLKTTNNKFRIILVLTGILIDILTYIIRGAIFLDDDLRSSSLLT